MNHLVERAKRGDKSAEQEIFAQLHDRFSLLARRKISDREAACDVAQKACLTVLEKYKMETFTVGFEAWAYGVLLMNIRSYYHAVSSDRPATVSLSAEEVAHLSPSPAVDPSVESRLLECLRKLVIHNRRYARVLNLSYQGYLVPEICEKLNVSANALYVLLNRARSALWTCLND
jgi:DNA-directed RNA polymerase specialized sigma24 family protein